MGEEVFVVCKIILKKTIAISNKLVYNLTNLLLCNCKSDLKRNINMRNEKTISYGIKISLLIFFIVLFIVLCAGAVFFAYKHFSEQPSEILKNQILYIAISIILLFFFFILLLRLLNYFLQIIKIESLNKAYSEYKEMNLSMADRILEETKSSKYNQSDSIVKQKLVKLNPIDMFKIYTNTLIEL